MKEIRIRATFVEPVLGTAPNNKNIYGDYIATKAPDAKTKEEEIAAIGVEEYEDKKLTVFPRDENDNPFFWDYQIKGFFKDSCSSLQRCKGEEFSKASCKIKAFKRVIDSVIFIKERKIPINYEGRIELLWRPLRAQTAQGERVALASSEMISAGSWIEFSVVCLSDEYEAAVLEWLNYGKWRGLSQWRNASFGRFYYEIIE